MNKSIIPLLVLIGAAFALVFWFWFSPMNMNVVQPHRGVAIQAVYGTGVVESEHLVDIRPLRSGLISAVVAKEGQRMQPQQALVVLADQVVDMQIRKQSLLIEQKLRDLERARLLFNRRAMAPETFEQLENALKVEQATLAELTAKGHEMVLRSPGDCLVLREDAKQGGVAQVQDVLFSLDCGEQLRVVAEIDEEELSEVAIGQTVLLSADAYPGKVFDGRITEITPLIDAVSRSFRVRVAFATDEVIDLPVGLSMELNIVIKQQSDAILVPVSAVAGDAVGVVEVGAVQHRRVRIGNRGERAVEIVEGLDDNTLVILNFFPEKQPDGLSVSTRLVPWD